METDHSFDTREDTCVPTERHYNIKQSSGGGRHLRPNSMSAKPVSINSTAQVMKPFGEDRSAHRTRKQFQSINKFRNSSTVDGKNKKGFVDENRKASINAVQ